MGVLEIFVLLFCVIGLASTYIVVSVIVADGNETLWEVFDRASDGVTWPYLAIKAFVVWSSKWIMKLVALSKRGKDNA